MGVAVPQVWGYVLQNRVLWGKCSMGGLHCASPYGGEHPIERLLHSSACGARKPMGGQQHTGTYGMRNPMGQQQPYGVSNPMG